MNKFRYIIFCVCHSLLFSIATFGTPVLALYLGVCVGELCITVHFPVWLTVTTDTLVTVGLIALGMVYLLAPYENWLEPKLDWSYGAVNTRWI